MQVGIRVRPLLPKYVTQYPIDGLCFMLYTLHVISREIANGEAKRWVVTPKSLIPKDSKLGSRYSFSKFKAYVAQNEVAIV